MRISDWSSDVCSSDLHPCSSSGAVQSTSMTARSRSPKRDEGRGIRGMGQIVPTESVVLQSVVITTVRRSCPRARGSESCMEVVDIARWQFGIITVYHFLFVPITIGLSFIIALFETCWVRTQNEHWLRLTKFFGKLFLINFAIGLVTVIVQEFQFGMNWRSEEHTSELQ